MLSRRCYRSRYLPDTGAIGSFQINGPIGNERGSVAIRVFLPPQIETSSSLSRGHLALSCSHTRRYYQRDLEDMLVELGARTTEKWTVQHRFSSDSSFCDCFIRQVPVKSRWPCLFPAIVDPLPIVDKVRSIPDRRVSFETSLKRKYRGGGGGGGGGSGGSGDGDGGGGRTSRDFLSVSSNVVSKMWKEEKEEEEKQEQEKEIK
ncbi:hypothetical protein V1478_015288 [Vespula squamosa]|uniref:Uncharacterized protein n=1 Tax=Vespula squamosa TaxID=30214 RepID=A0ABD2A4P1_VESSQ